MTDSINKHAHQTLTGVYGHRGNLRSGGAKARMQDTPTKRTPLYPLQAHTHTHTLTGLRRGAGFKLGTSLVSAFCT